jgi:hypothetical protein
MKDWLITPYSGTDGTYEMSGEAYHGIYVVNLDNANPLYFTVPGLGEQALVGNQQYRDYFRVPFNTASIRNPYGCKFILARVD